MPHASSTVRQAPALDHRFSNRQPLPDRGPSLDANEHGSRIRAHRVLSASVDDVLTAWTSAPAWERWMRLRSKSRATIASCVGGAFRLEIAEGPAIHVITGEVTHLSGEQLALTWLHHDNSALSSRITVTVAETEYGTEMLFVHDHLASRREAAWLMRFWPTALARFGDLVSRREIRLM